MDKKELTDVLVRIQAIIRDSDQIEKTQIRHIDDLVERALAQEEDDFPVPQEELTEFLDKFAEKEYYNVCTDMLSGEFCYAEYYDSDEENIMFELKYGVNDGDENVEYTDNFRISIYDFQNCKTFEEKYLAVQDG